MTADGDVRVPEGSPPASLNALMKLFLKTPGLQRWLGKGVALLTFTGAKSGKQYTIPVSYDRQENTVVMLTKRRRKWWRNFATRPEVRLRLAGETVSGTARASIGEEDHLPELIAYLEHRPIDAKAYGLTMGPDRRIDPEQARRLLPQIVVIDVDL